MELYARFREHTLCKWGKHCSARKREEKFNGGAGAQLCCYCRLIVEYGFKK